VIFSKWLRLEKKIISQGKVDVDGKVRLKDDFPVGLMDIISMPDMNMFYRVLPSHKGLFLNPISKEEASFKLLRVEDKTLVKNGASQIAFHDGTTMLVKAGDSENPQEVVYETFATLKLGIPEKQILDQLKTKKGNIAFITGGKNIGKKGKIVEIEKAQAKKRRNALVVVEDEKGGRYQTILDFVFSIGEAKSLISLPEVDSVV
jgi:small subunit ribosomal protein S4e